MKYLVLMKSYRHFFNRLMDTNRSKDAGYIKLNIDFIQMGMVEVIAGAMCSFSDSRLK